ncbi:MAG: glycosyltransferase family 4 protein [bacterium]|nr:glycosyltransferase family 4 protein [bacterium]
MRIAIIQAALSVSGGGERQAINLTRELRVAGFDAVLYSFRFNPATCFPDEVRGLPVVSLPEIPPPFYKKFFRVPFIGFLLQSAYDNRLARRLAALIPDDTEILNPHDQTSCRTAYYFKKRHPHTPAVLMLNDLHTASWSLFDAPLFGRKRKSIFKMPFYRLRDFYERRVFWKSIDQIAVLNERTTQILKRETWRDSVVVRSGVSAERFPFRARAPLDKSKEIRLLTHGIFYIHRRFEDIIRVVALLHDAGYSAHLQIVGDYMHRDIARAYYEKLRELVRELHLENSVTFSGVVSDAELLSAYYQSDIFISAAHMQTWGLAVFEALATGLPAVISQTIGAAEVLKDGETALFIEPGNPASIARAVRKLAYDGALYERLNKDGAAFVRANLSWKKYAADMQTVFEKTLQKRSAAYSK